MLIGCGILATTVAILVWNWIVRGEQRLEHELEQIRASGAPLFPEQIVFAPRSKGQDPAAWWKAIDAAHVEWTIDGLPECASRIAAGGNEAEIISECEAAVRDVRRVGALSACELAVLRLSVVSDHEALDLAFQVGSFAPMDWHAAFLARIHSIDECYALPSIPGYLKSVRLLCARAVLSALDGDSAAARHELMLAHQATLLLGEPPSVIARLGKSVALAKWINSGLLPLLHLLPADTDWSEVDRVLASCDPSADFQRAFIGERAMGNAIYRFLRESDGLALELSDEGGTPSFVLRMVLDRDHANYLAWMRQGISIARERDSVDSWRDFDAEIDATSEGASTLIDGIVWRMIFFRLGSTGRQSLSERTRIHLVRAALIARRDGADAARAWLARERDPFNDEALRSRLDPDGFLAMWSVGEDGEDNPPVAEREEWTALDDILVEVRVR